MNPKNLIRSLIVLSVLSVVPGISSSPLAMAQEQSAVPAHLEPQASPEHKSFGGELAKETREAAGEEEENAQLKHSAVVQGLAKITGLSVHGAHQLAVWFNFAAVAFLIYWFARKAVPAALRARTAAIQKALEEARSASADANRRLAEIEARLGKLDTEISQMQAAAEKEAESEETRIRQAADEDIRKVVASAEQEIAAAAKQARRELTAHTADLAVSLARKQIHVDTAADQALVRNFAGKLPANGGKDSA